jgi:hypothetical protein
MCHNSTFQYVKVNKISKKLIGYYASNADEIMAHRANRMEIGIVYLVNYVSVH